MKSRRELLRSDDGTIIPLIMIFALIASLLLLVVIDSTVLFMNKRAIGTAADGAALAAAQAIDKTTLYGNGGIVNNQDLPLLSAKAAAAAYLTANRDDTIYPGLTVAVSALSGNRIQIVVTAPTVPLPFTGLALPNGVAISETATVVLRCGNGGARNCG